MKVCRASEMRSLDSKVIDKFGITTEILMENAGGAVFSVISRELGVAGRKFVIVCGSGDNGGDGLVVARKLHANGADVKVCLLGSRERLRGATKKNLKIISKMPIEISEVKSAEQVKDLIKHSDAIVDAIFGTGLTRDVKGVYRDVIQTINNHGRKVFSVDIPSGVSSDNGKVMGIAVNADYTITFGLPKIGNVLYPGYTLEGKLYISHISYPPSLYNSDNIKVELFQPLKLPQREEYTHKGDYGKALFIAGSSNYLGAPYFSALSFLKAGGGLSYLAAPSSICPFIANKGSEVVFVPQPETESGSIAQESEDGLLKFSEKVDMVVLGPGISLNEETQNLARRLIGKIKKPMLVDGDGITAVSKDLDLVKKRGAKTILTPHPGEMSRITGKEIEEIKNNRIDTLQETARDLSVIVVLKEANSLIGYPNGKVLVNTSGNPGMATAGSGDVLTGTIFGIYGLGFSIDDSVPLGVFIHGLAGDLVAEEKGKDGITAQDLLDYLPWTLKYYRENFEEIARNIYGSVRVV